MPTRLPRSAAALAALLALASLSGCTLVLPPLAGRPAPPAGAPLSAAAPTASVADAADALVLSFRNRPPTRNVRTVMLAGDRLAWTHRSGLEGEAALADVARVERCQQAPRGGRVLLGTVGGTSDGFLLGALAASALLDEKEGLAAPLFAMLAAGVGGGVGAFLGGRSAPRVCTALWHAP